MRNGNRRRDDNQRNEREIPANDRTREEARHAEVMNGLRVLSNAVYVLLWKAYKMSKEMDDLTAEVAETKGIMASAKVLIEGFAARLEAAGTDPAKLNALREDLDTSSTDLAKAVAANSPQTGGSVGGDTGGSTAGDNGNG